MARDKQLEDRIRKDYVGYFIGRRTNASKALEGLKRLIGNSRIKRLDIDIDYDMWVRYQGSPHLSSRLNHQFDEGRVVKKLATLHKIINHSGKIVWFVVNRDSWAVVPISYDQWREQDAQIMVANVMGN